MAIVSMDLQEAEAGAPSPGDIAREFVEDVLDAIGMDCTVEAEQDEDGTWRLEVLGDGAGDLIGRYGDTINALQYLTTLATLREVGGHVRVQLDAEGYRDRRQAALVEQARELAAEVIRVGQEAELDPLNAFERRIIHNALSNHPEVITYSEGEGEDRRVIIAPRKKG
jgi:spoIIIJ-associated protein